MDISAIEKLSLQENDLVIIRMNATAPHSEWIGTLRVLEKLRDSSGAFFIITTEKDHFDVTKMSRYEIEKLADQCAKALGQGAAALREPVNDDSCAASVGGAEIMPRGKVNVSSRRDS